MMAIEEPKSTLYYRTKGSNCLECSLVGNMIFPADIVARLMKSSLRWMWESYLLRSEYQCKSHLPKHRPFTELSDRSAGLFGADVIEQFEGEHRFIILIGYQSSDPLSIEFELARFTQGDTSRIRVVIVHVGDTPSLFLHFPGAISQGASIVRDLLGDEIDSTRVFQRPYRKLGVGMLETIFRLPPWKE
jgi:hypothetical protein